LSNLHPQSDRFWGVVVAAYTLTATFLYLVLAEWHYFLDLRSRHFARAVRGLSSGGAEAVQARRSVMVELIPPEDRTEAAVRSFFEQLFGEGSVHSCVLPNASSNIHRLLDRALPQPARELLQREVAPAGETLLPRDSSSNPSSLAWGLGQQALGAVQILEDVTIGRAVASTGFLTLKSVAHAVEAQQVLLSRAGRWVVLGAPEPRDLIWQNVPTPMPQVLLRHALAQAACVAGLIFWSAPVALIQGWAEIGNLQKWFPFVKELQGLPVVYSFLTSYLPVVALIGLQCLLPRIFELMAVRYEGHKTKSEIQRIVLNRCFGYQLASLCVTMITASIWIELRNILQSPASILGLLSNSLPKVAVYFVTFVLARVGVSLPLLLLRPWDLLGGSRAEAVARCAFGSEGANAALVLVIGLTYSFIAPAILPACVLYFGLAVLIYRWLFTYVYEPEFDSGGTFWYDLFNSVLLGLLLGTLALVALACVRATPVQVALLVPLPIGVVWFGYWCWRHLGATSKWVTLLDAVRADEDDGTMPDLSPQLYRSPLDVLADTTAGTGTGVSGSGGGGPMGDVQCGAAANGSVELPDQAAAPS